jgi:protein-L-isoaspartate(D-aspartate) O-methyltransferase
MNTKPLTQEDLVETIQRAGIGNDKLIEAFRKIPRKDFVPREFATLAYVDDPIPIPHHQVTTQPSLSAKMIDALDIADTDTVLEVGTGFGFQTALLACLARFVYSIERWPDLAERARKNLELREITNVEVFVGDGSAGMSKHAPFQAILVSAAFPQVPQPLRDQLAVGGRLVQPIGTGGHDEVVLFQRTAQGLEMKGSVTPARFVRLYGANGFPAR